jgi:hypothetical protein
MPAGPFRLRQGSLRGPGRGQPYAARSPIKGTASPTTAATSGASSGKAPYGMTALTPAARSSASLGRSAREPTPPAAEECLVDRQARRQPRRCEGARRDAMRGARRGAMPGVTRCSDRRAPSAGPSATTTHGDRGEGTRVPRVTGTGGTAARMYRRWAQRFFRQTSPSRPSGRPSRVLSMVEGQ